MKCIDRETAVEATAWFSVLARAMTTADQQGAAEARHALERLGVRVAFLSSEEIEARKSTAT